MITKMFLSGRKKANKFGMRWRGWGKAFYEQGAMMQKAVVDACLPTYLPYILREGSREQGLIAPVNS